MDLHHLFLRIAILCSQVAAGETEVDFTRRHLSCYVGRSLKPHLYRFKSAKHGYILPRIGQYNLQSNVLQKLSSLVGHSAFARNCDPEHAARPRVADISHNGGRFARFRRHAQQIPWFCMRTHVILYRAQPDSLSCCCCRYRCRACSTCTASTPCAMDCTRTPHPNNLGARKRSTTRRAFSSPHHGRSSDKSLLLELACK
mmetsp:Transcript_884/g.2431  ORF Transcript_884/g.2431 Transcript_884/m.2431 type:complete len:200 (-) Transcript_884:15-614(-)